MGRGVIREDSWDRTKPSEMGKRDKGRRKARFGRGKREKIKGTHINGLNSESLKEAPTSKGGVARKRLAKIRKGQGLRGGIQRPRGGPQKEDVRGIREEKE